MTGNNVIRLPVEDMGQKGSQEPPLKSGGGDGTFDDMEARVSKLEGQFDKLNDKVDELRIDVAVLKERVGNLPTKGFIVTALLSSLALLTALIVFQDRIASMIAGG